MTDDHISSSASRTDPLHPAPPPGQAKSAALALELRDVSKSYDRRTLALDRVSLQVPRGSFLAVMGPSGSGKSTLLQCAAGLDTPTSGQVFVDGHEISGLKETARTLVRRDLVGFVFQSYNLMPALTVEENITLPLRLADATPDMGWVRRLVDRIGLGPYLQRRPAELSGGQQQRVAIARSLAARPAVVFADEPTGALDGATAAEVLTLLRDLVDEFDQTVVMVTHDPTAAARAHGTVVVGEGRIQEYLTPARSA